MIEQCKVTMECRLIDHVKLPTHDLFVGEVVGTYADVDVLTNGVVDIAKLRPLLFDMASKKYWGLGDPVAKCWSVGKESSRRAEAPASRLGGARRARRATVSCSRPSPARALPWRSASAS